MQQQAFVALRLTNVGCGFIYLIKRIIGGGFFGDWAAGGVLWYEPQHAAHAHFVALIARPMSQRRKLLLRAFMCVWSVALCFLACWY